MLENPTVSIALLAKLEVATAAKTEYAGVEYISYLNVMFET